MTLESSHNESQLPNATNRVVAVFDSREQAETAATHVAALGISGEVDVRCGATAAEEIDFSGHRQGVVAKAQRTAHSWTDSVEMQHFGDELRAGHCLLVYHAAVLPDLAPVLAALKATGGRYIHHFGPLVVSQLEP